MQTTKTTQQATTVSQASLGQKSTKIPYIRDIVEHQDSYSSVTKNLEINFLISGFIFDFFKVTGIDMGQKNRNSLTGHIEAIVNGSSMTLTTWLEGVGELKSVSKATISSYEKKLEDLVKKIKGVMEMAD